MAELRKRETSKGQSFEDRVKCCARYAGGKTCASRNNGTLNGDGSYTLTTADLAGLKLTAAEAGGTLHLVVTSAEGTDSTTSYWAQELRVPVPRKLCTVLEPSSVTPMPRARPLTAHSTGLGNVASWSMSPGKPWAPG